MTAVDTWRPLLAGVDTVINAVGIIAETRGQRFEPIHHLAPAALFGACVDRAGSALPARVRKSMVGDRQHWH